MTHDGFPSPSGWVHAQSASVRVGCTTGDAEVHALQSRVSPGVGREP